MTVTKSTVYGVIQDLIKLAIVAAGFVFHKSLDLSGSDQVALASVLSGLVSAKWIAALNHVVSDAKVVATKPTFAEALKIVQDGIKTVETPSTSALTGETV